MKSVILLIAVAFSTAANAQVDPAFTAKFKTVSDAVKAYHLASQDDKPSKMQLVLDAAQEFYPMPVTEFQSKLYAMINSPVEVAKLGNPVGFTQCLAVAVSDFHACVTDYNQQLMSPQPPLIPTQCSVPAINSIATCVNTYLH